MKPFSLSAALKYRKQLQDAAVTRLVQAERDLQARQEEMDETNHRYAALLARMETLQTSGMAIEDLLRHEHHLEWLVQIRKQKEAELQAAALKVRQKRQLVMERSRDLQVLEKLKTKQDAQWRRHLEKLDAAQLDEIAILSHDRKQQEKN